MIPLTVFEFLVRNEEFFWGDPTAAGGFAEDVAGFGSFLTASFDLDLGAKNSATVFVGVFIFAAGADHYARVQLVVHFGIKLEFEVVVEFVGGEEGVGASIDGRANDGVAFDGVFGFTAHDSPVGEVFAVEEVGPAGVEFLDLKVAIPDFIVVVLEEDTASGVGGEVGDVFEF